jgi:hypothetical protein
MASVLDQLRADAWAAGGGKGRRPRPTPRPGVEGGRSRMRIGDAMTTEEFDRRMADKRRKAGTA